MLAVIVLPTALAAVIAFFVAIAPITSAIGTLSSAASTTDKIVTDVKADVVKRKANKKTQAQAPFVANW
jgi:hypothetical protein